MDITPLEMSDGDPMYFTRGHVDLAEFMAQVVTGFDEDAEGLEMPAHGYFTDEPPCDQWPDGWFKYAKAEDPGAYAITLTHP